MKPKLLLQRIPLSGNSGAPSAKSPGDSPWFSDVVGEAGRNFICGATKGFILALAFFLLCGGAAVAQSRLVVGLVVQALTYRSSGAAIYTVQSMGSVNGEQCDALSSLAGILASGAIRPGADSTLAVLPSTAVSSFEVTPGFRNLLDLTSSDSHSGTGVWIASDLADRAAIEVGDDVPLTDSATMHVDAVYQWPLDGRSPTLSYHIISPVAPVGVFDECWVLAWPDVGAAIDVLTLPIFPMQVSADGQVNSPQTAQLNMTLGTNFNGAAKFAGLPLLPLEIVAVGIAACLGFVSIRVRRLEMAGALHAGMAKTALGVQIGIETLAWTILGALPAIAVDLWASKWGNMADWYPAFYPAMRTLVLCVVAALLFAEFALALTKERHLFRYFKQH